MEQSQHKQIHRPGDGRNKGGRRMKSSQHLTLIFATDVAFWATYLRTASEVAELRALCRRPARISEHSHGGGRTRRLGPDQLRGIGGSSPATDDH